MIYSVIAKDKCVAANVRTICCGASELQLRGYEQTSREIFKMLENKNLIKCDW